jgi:2-polyprenyl-3-methyl-5-hydroxy-6-metoxy-1,4-benzoquinol methylase
MMLEKGLTQQDYDHLYLTDDETYDKPSRSPYYALYSQALGMVRQAELGSVLEVGCGSGVFAEMLLDSGLSYAGFDFSPVAVEKAKRRTQKGRFFVGDATDPACYADPYDGIVCCEVLEHLDGDLDAVALWRRGALCVCAVPNFDGEHHVRFFRSEAEVIDRYGGLLDIHRITRVPKAAGAGLTWAQYFRRLRWSRDQPKRVLGILGVNTFDWYGGWFTFVARRR